MISLTHQTLHRSAPLPVQLEAPPTPRPPGPRSQPETGVRFEQTELDGSWLIVATSVEKMVK